MKLSVSINLFDSEELLEFSLKNIRPFADHISIVYQTISNFGNPANPGLEALLNQLKAEGLADELYLYHPNLKLKPFENETIKRQIGWKLAEKAKATHFMSKDCDEFYNPEEFRRAKEFILENDISCSVAHFVNYVVKPTYRSKTLHANFVPFICKLKPGIRHGGYTLFQRILKKLGLFKTFPFPVDPTRVLVGFSDVFCFSPENLIMHHMWCVRKDLIMKYKNSSWSDNPENRAKGERFVTFLETFKIEEQSDKWEQVPDQFGITGF